MELNTSVVFVANFEVLHFLHIFYFFTGEWMITPLTKN